MDILSYPMEDLSTLTTTIFSSGVSHCSTFLGMSQWIRIMCKDELIKIYIGYTAEIFVLLLMHNMNYKHVKYLSGYLSSQHSSIQTVIVQYNKRALELMDDAIEKFLSTLTTNTTGFWGEEEQEIFRSELEKSWKVIKERMSGRVRIIEKGDKVKGLALHRYIDVCRSLILLHPDLWDCGETSPWTLMKMYAVEYWTRRRKVNPGQILMTTKKDCVITKGWVFNMQKWYVCIADMYIL